MNDGFDDCGGYNCSICGCWLVEVNNEIDHIHYRNWNRDSVLLCNTCLRTVREVIP